MALPACQRVVVVLRYYDDLQVTLTNSSGRPLTLQPTPTYLIAIELSDGAGSDYQIEHLLPLKPGALVVPAHGTLRLCGTVPTIVTRNRSNSAS